MKKTQHNKGFTMAEMLIVVAIIIALAAFAFVGIAYYQRSLHQLEMDGIAKEIFVAAQNHLAMADSQGLLKADQAGYIEDEVKGIYYYVVDDGVDGYPVDGRNRALDLMLPFASVDETVRLGGSYIIRYQLPKEKLQAKVLDVFYATKTGRFAYAFDVSEYNGLISGYRGSEHKGDRRKYTGGSVIGWYGGEDAKNLTRGDELKVPTIEVVNAERLLVKVSNPNSTIDKAGLRLVITGKNSGNKRLIDLIKNDGRIDSKYADVTGKKSAFTVVLDDVTSDTEHFHQLFCSSNADTSKNLIPGENITVQAISYNNTALTNIAYSSEVKTNSLFASLEPPVDPSTTYTANIANFRHLENLSNAISGFDSTIQSQTDSTKKITITDAKQIADMDWNQFMSVISGIKAGEADFDKVQIHPITGTASNHGFYMPVSFTKNDNSTYSLNYDGQGNKIMNVQVSHNGPAGIFGTLKNCSISNVLVCNNVPDDSSYLISGTRTGAAVGGLVGEMEGGSINQCAAAVYVNATNGDAGGLVGKTTGTVTIENSYVGGHTFEGRYEEHTEDRKVNTNVVSTGGNAGGLIGNGDGTLTVANCYSTASAKGGTSVGGLIGTVSTATVNNSYATGLVVAANDSTSKGAFIGSGTLKTSSKDNLYYSIINGDLKAVNQVDGGGNVTNVDMNGISAFDATLATYNQFVPLVKDGRPNTASPYDTTLTTSYPTNQYALKTISELKPSSNPTEQTPTPDWMNKHYGDWPSMETLVINEKNAPATP